SIDLRSVHRCATVDRWTSRTDWNCRCATRLHWKRRAWSERRRLGDRANERHEAFLQIGLCGGNPALVEPFGLVAFLDQGVDLLGDALRLVDERDFGLAQLAVAGDVPMLVFHDAPLG